MPPSPKSIFLESFEAVKNRRMLFFLVVVFQLVFLVLFSINFTYFSIKIMELLGIIVSAIESINPSEVISSTIENPLEIYQNWNVIIKYVIYFAVLSYLLYVVLNGANWKLSARFFTKEKFNFMASFVYDIRFGLILLVFFIPSYLILDLLSGIFIKLGFLEPLAFIFPIVAAITLYFMMLAIGIITAKSDETFLAAIKNAFRLGVKKFIPLILNYILILVFIAIFLALAVLSILKTDYFSLMVVSIILFAVALVFSRIYFICFVKELINNKY